MNIQLNYICALFKICYLWYASIKNNVFQIYQNILNNF